MRSKEFYWELFKSTFIISAFTVGGGFVIVPLFQKRFVDELQWIEEDEILSLVAISQSAPGSIAINGASMIGYQLGGLSGAIVALLGTALAPLLIMSIISYFYIIVRDSLIISAILKGMQAGVAAIIVKVVIKMIMQVIQSKDLISMIILILSIVGFIFFDIHFIIILIASGVTGAIKTICQAKRKGVNN